MNTKQSIVYWFPRVLAILFIGFLLLLAMDSFTGNSSLLQKFTGFIIEGGPAIALILILWFAWKNGTAGGILFLVMALLFTLFYHTYQRWDTFILISLPLVLIGGTFMLNKNK
jgi:hypothetical protein